MGILASHTPQASTHHTPSNIITSGNFNPPPNHQAIFNPPPTHPPSNIITYGKLATLSKSSTKETFQSLASWHLQLFPVVIVSSWRNETEKCQYCGLIGLQGNPLSSQIIDHQTVKFFYFATGWIKSNMTIHQS